jgi:hypothetical protein
MTNFMNISSAPAQFSAEQLFRASCGLYQVAVDQLNVDVGTGRVTEDNAKERIAELCNAEKNALEALETAVKGTPHEKVVIAYYTSAMGFFRALAAAVNMGVDPLAPKYRRDTKRIFETWKNAEQAYARAGFRTISYDDFYAPFNDEVLRISAIGKMLVVREAGEQPVFHCVEHQRKTPKLKI